jgi:hypothetical protein
MSKRMTAIGLLSLLFILVGHSALWAPPPAAKNFYPFLRQIIYLPAIIQVLNGTTELDGVKEDTAYNFWLFQKKSRNYAIDADKRTSSPPYLESEPGSDATFWINWGDGTTTNLPNLRDGGTVREYAAFSQTNTSVNNHQALNKTYFHSTAQDSYEIRLYYRYRKQANPTEIFPQYTWETENLLLRTIRVGNHEIPKARNLYLVVTPTGEGAGYLGIASSTGNFPVVTVNEDKDVVFTAKTFYPTKKNVSDTANWPYSQILGESPTATSKDTFWESDFANGIATNSVRVRWRVFRPATGVAGAQGDTSTLGWVEYESSWATLADTSETLPAMSGINRRATSLSAPATNGANTFTYRFLTPFESTNSSNAQHYTVALDLEFTHFVYTPVYQKGDLGNWFITRFTNGNCVSTVRQLNTGNTYAYYKLADQATFEGLTPFTSTYARPSTYSPLAPNTPDPASRVRARTTPVKVLVRDTQTATAAFIFGPSEGTTGDPLQNYMVRFQVTDNNPHAEILSEALGHDYFDAGTKSCSKLENRDKSTGEMNGAKSVTTIASQTPTTGVYRCYDPDNTSQGLDGIYNNIVKYYDFEFGRDMDPDWYKIRMPTAYAATMDDADDYGDSVNNKNHPLRYCGVFQINDRVAGPYFIQSASYTSDGVNQGDFQQVVVNDNDSPVASISFRIDPPVTYEVTNYFNGFDRIPFGDMDSNNPVDPDDVDPDTFHPFPSYTDSYPKVVLSGAPEPNDTPLHYELLKLSMPNTGVPNPMVLDNQLDPWKVRLADTTKPLQTIFISNDDYLPIIYAGARTPIFWSAWDNVHGPLGLDNIPLGTGNRFEFAYYTDYPNGKNEIAIVDRFFFIEKKPDVTPPAKPKIRCEFKFYDKQRNCRTIMFDALVYELGFQPRVLETTVTGTRRDSK